MHRRDDLSGRRGRQDRRDLVRRDLLLDVQTTDYQRGLERVVIRMTPSEYTVVQVQDWIDQDDSIAEIELDGV